MIGNIHTLSLNNSFNNVGEQESIALFTKSFMVCYLIKREQDIIRLKLSK